MAIRPTTKAKAKAIKKPVVQRVKRKKKDDYKVRLNEVVSTKQVNSVLDAIDANGGYCPCQPKSRKTKCHCDDFRNNKQIGEPCICNIYVKQPNG